MQRSLAAAAFAFAVAGAPHASAEGAFSDRFFRGTSPGELPAAKLVTIGGLYTLSAASVSLGVVSLVRASSQGDEADAFKLAQPRGFCSDLSSAACITYHDLVAEERSSRTLGIALFGLGGVLALGGAMTAELWSNDLPVTPKVALDFHDGGAAFSLVGVW